MRRAIITLAFLAGIAPAFAQQAPQPSASPVQIMLSTQDQSDLRGICMLAMRSPVVTDPDQAIIIGAYCAKLRDLMIAANAVPLPNPAPQPKE